MKFLCRPCNQYMGYLRHDIVNAGSLDIGFKCPSCGREVSLITNAGETQLVSSFGVNLGGGEENTPPMQMTTSSLKTDDSPAADQIRWEPAAEERLNNVPHFVRPMVKRAIEQYARNNGITIIDFSVMDHAKESLNH